MLRKRLAIGLGELLWDLFPAGKQLGGAPANFAYIASLLGDRGIPASRLGRDDLGGQAMRRLEDLGLSTELIQQDTEHPTGTVKVQVDSAGQPHFEISERVAWDYFEWTEAWRDLAEKAEAVCFGSLAQRSERSRATIGDFVRSTPRDAVRVLDVNLRQHFYSAEIVADSMKLANMVKLNHEELPRVMRLLGMEHRGEEDSAQRLLAEYELQLVCVTRGQHGSLLLSPEERDEHPGFRVQVADTVGAGDAFTAAMVHGYLRNTSLAKINERANRVGAWVASQPGATPAPKDGDVEKSLAAIV